MERVHGRVVPIMASAARTAKLDTEWLVIMKGTMVTWVVMNYHWIPRAFFPCYYCQHPGSRKFPQIDLQTAT